MRFRLDRIRTLHRRRLARNASWILLGQGANFLLQAGCFVLLARLLGSMQYGIFAGVFALINTVAPYSALGSGVLFMRYVPADESVAPIYWGNALLTMGTITIAIAGAFSLLGPPITGIHNQLLIFNVVVANCFFTQVLTVASKIFQTYERMKLSATLMLLSNLSRFLVLLAMWLALKHATAVQWSSAVLLATGVTAAVAFGMVQSAVRRIAVDLRILARRFWEGLGYSVGTTSMAIYNDVDKTLLSHYGMNVQNGIYSLAYRVMDFCFTPVGSIDAAILPRYFALSLQGHRQVGRLAAKAVPTAALIGVVVSAGLWLAAPVIPHLIGPDFSQTALALRWICLIPPLRAVHVLSGSSLTASGKQHLRLVAQFFVAGLNIGLNIWLIPKHGWLGAAWASLASDGTLAALNLLLIFIVMRGSDDEQGKGQLLEAAHA